MKSTYLLRQFFSTIRFLHTKHKYITHQESLNNPEFSTPSRKALAKPKMVTSLGKVEYLIRNKKSSKHKRVFQTTYPIRFIILFQ